MIGIQHLTRMQARASAKKMTRESGMKHIPIKTRYYSMDIDDYISCWTVVLTGGVK